MQGFRDLGVRVLGSVRLSQQVDSPDRKSYDKPSYPLST